MNLATVLPDENPGTISVASVIASLNQSHNGLGTYITKNPLPLHKNIVDGLLNDPDGSKFKNYASSMLNAYLQQRASQGETGTPDSSPEPTQLTEPAEPVEPVTQGDGRKRARKHEHDHGRDHKHDHKHDHDHDHGRDHKHDHEREHGRDHKHDHARDHERKHARDHERKHERERQPMPVPQDPMPMPQEPTPQEPTPQEPKPENPMPMPQDPMPMPQGPMSDQPAEDMRPAYHHAQKLLHMASDYSKMSLWGDSCSNVGPLVKSLVKSSSECVKVVSCHTGANVSLTDEKYGSFKMLDGRSVSASMVCLTYNNKAVSKWIKVSKGKWALLVYASVDDLMKVLHKLSVTQWSVRGSRINITSPGLIRKLISDYEPHMCPFGIVTA